MYQRRIAASTAYWIQLIEGSCFSANPIRDQLRLHHEAVALLSHYQVEAADGVAFRCPPALGGLPAAWATMQLWAFDEAGPLRAIRIARLLVSPRTGVDARRRCLLDKPVNERHEKPPLNVDVVRQVARQWSRL